MSRISTRFFASAGLSGGEPPGDCSASNVVETTKGISCDSTPSFARSSGAMGGSSGEGTYSSVNHACDGGDWYTLWGTWILTDIVILEGMRQKANAT